MLSRRFSIKTRSIVSMAVMLGVIIALAALTFRNGADQQARSEHIRTMPLRALHWSHRIAGEMTKLQLLVFQHVIADDPVVMANLEAKVAYSLEAVDRLWIEYDEGPSMPPLLAAEVEQTRALWGAFRPQVQSAIPLSSAGEKSLAQRLAQRDLSTLGRDIVAHLERMVTLSSAEASQAFEASEDAYGRQLALTDVIVACGCALALALSLGLVRSLRRLTASIIDPVLAMAEGRFEPVPGQRDATELGRTIGALQALQGSLAAAREVQAREEAMRQEIEGERRRLLVGIASEIDADVGEMVRALVSASAALDRRATEMLDNASVAVREGHAVAGSVEVTSNNVQIVAAASEELAAVAEGIASEAQAAAKAAAHALEAVRVSQDQAAELLASANEISAVVQLVNSVAAQTNLLALNATIEAARAGDAGRGFAVVAGEVKLLAEETSRATNRITEQVDRLQTLARRSAELTQDMKHSVETSTAFSLNVRVASDEQRAAITEIATRIEETAVETERVSGSIQAVQNTVVSSQELAKAVVISSRQLAAHADGLVGGVRQLKSALSGG